MCCICILFSKCINFRIIDRQKIVLSNYSKIYRFKDSSDSIIYVPRYCLVLLLYEPDFCSGISENTTTWICQMIKMLKVVNIVFYDDCSRYWNVQDVFWWLQQSSLFNDAIQRKCRHSYENKRLLDVDKMSKRKRPMKVTDGGN